MSAKARRQAGSLEQVRAAVEGMSWNHDFLAEYVNALGYQSQEEDLFRRLAFRSAEPSAADAKIANSLSELYDAMSSEDKSALRQCWHEKVRREAYEHDDLRARLAWRFFV